MPLPFEVPILRSPINLNGGASHFTTARFEAGKVVLIAGPNGVGKSALIHELFIRAGQGNATYYPGHRQITFNNGWDNVQQDMDQLSIHFYQQNASFNRFKGAWGEDHFKSVIKRLQNAESTFNRILIDRIRKGDEEAHRNLQDIVGPISKLNAVFLAAGLAISFDTDDLGLRVNREGQTYRIDQMSDGERAALFIVGAIIVQSENTIIMIDEPERHLHPSISGRLIQSAIAMRTDIAFLFATHDVALIESLSDASIIHIQNSIVQSLSPERRSYTLDVIPRNVSLPEGVKVEILGARSNALFVEGTPDSIDREVYSRVYAGWKIIPKGGWEQCANAVKALTGNDEVHWINAVGLIDGDGKSAGELQALREHNVFALDYPTVENLLFLPEVLEAMAQVIFALEGKETAAERLVRAKAQTSASLANHIDDIAARETVWRVNRILSERKLSVSQIRSGNFAIDKIDGSQIYSDSIERISAIIGSDDALNELRSIPIKNTRLMAELSKAIGFENFRQYQTILLNQIDIKSVAGCAISTAITNAVPVIE